MTGQSTIDPDHLRRRYLDDGAPVAEIAAEIGRDPAAIYRALRRDGIPLRGHPDRRDWSEILTYEYLDECQSAGMGTGDIAQAVDADWSTVAEWEARHGLSDRVDEQDRALVRRWYVEEGCSIAEVARRAMIGTRTARRWLLEAGVTLRPRGRPAGR